MTEQAALDPNLLRLFSIYQQVIVVHVGGGIVRKI